MDGATLRLSSWQYQRYNSESYTVSFTNRRGLPVCATELWISFTFVNDADIVVEKTCEHSTVEHRERIQRWNIFRTEFNMNDSHFWTRFVLQNGKYSQITILNTCWILLPLQMKNNQTMIALRKLVRFFSNVRLQTMRAAESSTDFDFISLLKYEYFSDETSKKRIQRQ